MININTIKNIIETQSNVASYSGLDCTRVQRLCIYEAFNDLLEKYPKEMMGYLIKSERGHHLQSILFQKYIQNLETKLPFSFIKNKQIYYIKSILDNELNIFDGISVFRAHISKNNIIKNSTIENYIGGKKNLYQRPYFMGKILDIIDDKKHISLLKYLSSYSFSEIILDSSVPRTEVLVSHLRIIPHYQMGAMSYINRIRKEIILAI